VLVLALTAACGTTQTGVTTSTEPAPTTTVPSPTTTSTTTSTTTASTTTTTTVPSPTTTPTTTPSLSPPMIGPGDSGPAVVALQRRLSSLGYWLGSPDGRFGDSTEQAVYALQKTAGISRDGVVGPVTEAALARGVVARPRSTSGHVVEVDLGDDLLMIVDDGKLTVTLNTSTGGGYTYVDRGVTALAETPVGVFRVFRQVDGLVVSSLGELWRPKFFYSGFAIHGASSVPPYPASHGCVRVSNAAIDWIWAENVLPIGTEVWVY